jgi:cytochrome P450
MTTSADAEAVASWYDIDNNLTNPEWYTDNGYREAFRRLRDEDPLHWSNDETFGRNYWVVTRFDDVKAVINDHVAFSNAFDSRIPRTSVRLSSDQRRELMFDANIALMDPPYHTVYRQPANKHFSIPAIGRMQPQIAEIIDSLLDSVAERGECDIVDDLAAELPMRVVFRLMGIPESDWPLLSQFSWQAFAPADPRGHIPGKNIVETSFSGIQSIAAYSLQMAQDRRANPRDDFATIITQMVVDGTPLDDHEIAGWFVGLIIGGLETTRNAASAGTWLFLTNPDQRDLLLSDPDKYSKGASEEVMRWVTPARGRLRVARSAYTLHGKTIKPGDWIMSYLSSANWDERHFNNPETFDIARTPNDHLALGVGAHLCLGRA